MLDRPALPARVKVPARPAIAREFQPPALALEDEEPPQPAWWVLYALIALLAAAVIWASFAKVDEIVVARGELVTSVPTLVVQPLERVPIKSIEVKVGDIVHKGQVLATLDPTFAEADFDELRAKVAGYSARQARLEAELANAPYLLPPNPNPSQLLEAALFAERKRGYDAHLHSYAENLARLNASLAAARADLQTTAARIEMLQEVVDIRQGLAEKALTSKLELLQSKAQLLAAQRDKLETEGKIGELTHQAESTAADRDAYIQEWREKAADELVTLRRDLVTAIEDLSKAERRRAMVTLVAPKDAIVLEIAQRSAGSVLREAETLFTLVPLDSPLLAEVRIMPRDIGLVHSGDTVRIKFDAFPFQKYGTGRGTIATISADSFQPPRADPSNTEAAPKPDTAGSFFKARVALTDSHLRNPPPDFRLLPGMTVNAEIKVGTRRVISYLLYPIHKGFDESLHEPSR